MVKEANKLRRRRPGCATALVNMNCWKINHATQGTRRTLRVFDFVSSCRFHCPTGLNSFRNHIVHHTVSATQTEPGSTEFFRIMDLFVSSLPITGSVDSVCISENVFSMQNSPPIRHQREFMICQVRYLDASVVCELSRLCNHAL